MMMNFKPKTVQLYLRSDNEKKVWEKANIQNLKI